MTDADKTGAPTPDERNWGMFGHLSALCGLIIPLGGIIGPLIIWATKKDQSAFIADNAREALNFNITVAIAAVVGIVLTFVLIGIVVLVVVFIGWLVLTIIAGIRASEGTVYQYPFTLRLVK
ncbi:MAG: DUF4870 domain-containing protein [Steroidobacteraceae bacterium]